MLQLHRSQQLSKVPPSLSLPLVFSSGVSCCPRGFASAARGPSRFSKQYAATSASNHGVRNRLELAPVPVRTGLNEREDHMGFTWCKKRLTTNLMNMKLDRGRKRPIINSDLDYDTLTPQYTGKPIPNVQERMAAYWEKEEYFKRRDVRIKEHLDKLVNMRSLSKREMLILLDQLEQGKFNLSQLQKYYLPEVKLADYIEQQEEEQRWQEAIGGGSAQTEKAQAKERKNKALAEIKQSKEKREALKENLKQLWKDDGAPVDASSESLSLEDASDADLKAVDVDEADEADEENDQQPQGEEAQANNEAQAADGEGKADDGDSFGEGSEGGSKSFSMSSMLTNIPDDPITSNFAKLLLDSNDKQWDYLSPYLIFEPDARHMHHLKGFSYEDRHIPYDTIKYQIGEYMKWHKVEKYKRRRFGIKDPPATSAKWDFRVSAAPLTNIGHDHRYLTGVFRRTLSRMGWRGGALPEEWRRKPRNRMRLPDSQLARDLRDKEAATFAKGKKLLEKHIRQFESGFDEEEQKGAKEVYRSIMLKQQKDEFRMRLLNEIRARKLQLKESVYKRLSKSFASPAQQSAASQLYLSFSSRNRASLKKMYLSTNNTLQRILIERCVETQLTSFRHPLDKQLTVKEINELENDMVDKVKKMYEKYKYFNVEEQAEQLLNARAIAEQQGHIVSDAQVTEATYRAMLNSNEIISPQQVAVPATPIDQLDEAAVAQRNKQIEDNQKYFSTLRLSSTNPDPLLDAEAHEQPLTDEVTLYELIEHLAAQGTDVSKVTDMIEGMEVDKKLLVGAAAPATPTSPQQVFGAQYDEKLNAVLDELRAQGVNIADAYAAVAEKKDTAVASQPQRPFDAAPVNPHWVQKLLRWEEREFLNSTVLPKFLENEAKVEKFQSGLLAYDDEFHRLVVGELARMMSSGEISATSPEEWSEDAIELARKRVARRKFSSPKEYNQWQLAEREWARSRLFNNNKQSQSSNTSSSNSASKPSSSSSSSNSSPTSSSSSTSTSSTVDSTATPSPSASSSATIDVSATTVNVSAATSTSNDALAPTTTKSDKVKSQEKWNALEQAVAPALKKLNQSMMGRSKISLGRVIRPITRSQLLRYWNNVNFLHRRDVDLVESAADPTIDQRVDRRLEAQSKLKSLDLPQFSDLEMIQIAKAEKRSLSAVLKDPKPILSVRELVPANTLTLRDPVYRRRFLDHLRSEDEQQANREAVKASKVDRTKLPGYVENMNTRNHEVASLAAFEANKDNLFDWEPIRVNGVDVQIGLSASLQTKVPFPTDDFRLYDKELTKERSAKKTDYGGEIYKRTGVEKDRMETDEYYKHNDKEYEYTLYLEKREKDKQLRLKNYLDLDPFGPPQDDERRAFDDKYFLFDEDEYEMKKRIDPLTTHPEPMSYKKNYNPHTGEHYQDYFTLADETCELLYYLHRNDPVRWTPRALAHKFRLSSARVLTALTCQAIHYRMIENGIDHPLMHKYDQDYAIEEVLKPSYGMIHAPAQLPKPLIADWRWVREEDMHKVLKEEQAIEQRFWSQSRKLDEKERKFYAHVGPIGVEPPQQHTPALLDTRVLSPSRHSMVMVDITELPQARYAIAVRNRLGQLREPTEEEYQAVRKREKGRFKFEYIKYFNEEVPTLDKINADLAEYNRLKEIGDALQAQLPPLPSLSKKPLRLNA